MFKENVAYIPNGVLLIFQKEGHPAFFVTTWMEFEIIILNEINRHRKTSAASCCHFHVEYETIELIEAENGPYRGCGPGEYVSGRHFFFYDTTCWT
jgi:hypothetical protein